MKFLVVFACVFVAAYGLEKAVIQKFMKKLEEIAPVCIQEVNASDKDLEELMAKKLPPSTHEGKCLISCFQRKLHIMNDDGTIADGDAEDLAIIKAGDEEFYNNLVKVHNACKEKVAVDADPCETATNMVICLKEEGHKMGLDESMLDI